MFENEDEQMARALAMSMATTTTQPDTSSSSSNTGAPLQDAAFMSSLVGNLPGVNMDDPKIQEALKGLETGKGKEGKESSSSSSSPTKKESGNQSPKKK